MYCKECGKLLGADDKFCSKCGTRVEEGEDAFVPAFKQTDAQAAKTEEVMIRRSVAPEHFDWDLDGYPTDNKKTEDIDFNWDSVLEEKQRNLFARELAQAEQRQQAGSADDKEGAPEGFVWSEQSNEGAIEDAAQPVSEEALFQEMDASIAEEPTRVMHRSESKTDGIDRFYTFNQKNAAFQALLDQEYERIQREQDFVPPFAAEAEKAAAAASLSSDAAAASTSRHEEFDWTLPGDRDLAAAIKAEAEEDSQETESYSEADPAQTEDAVDWSPQSAETEAGDTETVYVGVELANPPACYIELEPEAPVQAEPVQEMQCDEVAAAAQSAETAEPEIEDAYESSVNLYEAAAELPEETEEDADRQQLPPSRKAAKEEAEKDKSRLTFYDVFGTDDDDDGAPEEPEKKGKALKIIAAILVLFVALDLVAVGILQFAPNSKAGVLIDSGYQRILQLFTGEREPEEPPVVQQEPSLSEIAQLIDQKKSLGVNLATIEEDQNLLFEDGKDYGFEAFANAYTFVNKPWYTDDEGNAVSYGEDIIGTVIQYYSAWVDKINGKNDDILDFVDDASPFYSDIAALEEGEGVSYGINKLAIGEIRAGNAGFYILVSVAKVDSSAAEAFTEKQIVYMEPVNKHMKIVDIKDI